MSSRISASFVLLVLTLAPSAALAQPATPNPERVVVQQLITRFGELAQAGDVEAVVRGTFAWVAFRCEFGQGTAQVSGRGTAVLEKIDDRWVIVHLQMAS
jgi:hypothetical protein